MRICSVENCTKTHLARGFCSFHYQQKRSKKEIITTRLEKYCSVNGCIKKHLAKGYCSKHYQRISNSGEIIIKKEIFIKCLDCKKQIPSTRTFCFNCYHNRKEKQYQTQPKKRFDSSKKNAKQRELEWGITYELFYKLIHQNCYYCNNRYVTCGSGLDRIDNNKGYIETNIIPCCKFCNKMRGEYLTVPETLELIRHLKQIRNKENIWEDYYGS